MDEVFLDIIKKYLLKDENVLWIGRPDNKKMFTLSDIFLIPVGAICTISALLWEIYAILRIIIWIKQYDKNVIILFASMLIALIFAIIGLYLIIGRFIIKKRRKEKTLYVVTNIRILILEIGTLDKVVEKYINQISSMDVLIYNKFGTIRFGKDSFFNKFYANTGIEKLLDLYGNNTLAFYDICDAKKVYEMINRLRG